MREENIRNSEVDPHDGVEAVRARVESANDTSASYVQVVVQKHGGAMRGVRGERLPAASSPEPRPPKECGCRAVPITRTCYPQCTAAYDAGGVKRGCATLYPCVAHHHSDVVAEGAGDAGGCGAASPSVTQNGKKRCRTLWTQLTQTKEMAGPDRIEVYQFGAAGAVCARRSETRVERCMRPLGRRLAAFLDELLAVPRLLLPLPILVILRVQSCVLLSARNLVVEAARSVSELALTPALALLHDAVLRPPLVCAARSVTSLRDAVRPLWLVLADATEPLAHLLAQVRLVQVQHNCACVRDV